MEKWDYCVQGQGHSEALICQGIFVWMIFSPCVSLCLLNISLTAQPFFFFFFFGIKLGMVVYCHEAECHAEKLVHSLQCQGHSEGLYNKN